MPPKPRLQCALALSLLLWWPPATPAQGPLERWDDLDKSRKVLWSNVAGAAFITVWGVKNWEYFETSPRAEREHWFSQGTKKGGADKLGHFYTNYALSHGLAYLYGRWGYDRNRAALLGALSGWGLMGYMEVGDSFSQFGFSYEDMVMNTLGAAAGYWLYTRPEAYEKLDLRVEYEIAFDTVDFFTDYERMKYLAALKLDGFRGITNPVLRYTELHLGYYTRGYESDQQADHRFAYVGIGFNLSRLFRQTGHPRAATLFSYVQLPYTYVAAEEDLND